MPNRATLMTGRMPTLHGVRHNGIPLALDQTTFVELLAAAGYRTVLVGKAHLQNMTGKPALRRFVDEPGTTAPPPALREADRRLRAGEAYESENSTRWDDPAHAPRLPFYGFEEAHICTEHGDVVGGEYRRWLAEREPGWRGLVGRENALPPGDRIAPQAWRTRVPEELYPTAFVEDLSLCSLERFARDRDRPFFLQVSFPDPHHPFTPPGRYWDLYDPREIPLPRSFGKGDVAPLRRLREALANGTADRTQQNPFAVTADEARVCIALTYGMIAMIDDAVGRLLAALDRLGLADDTIVAFVSDHGDYMGDHGIMLKFVLHYQGLLRTPCIWYDPRSAGGGAARGDLAGTLDLARTILGRASLQPFHGMQGRDLFDPSQPAPDGILVEEDGPWPLFGDPQPDRVRTFVTDRWRLTLHEQGAWRELYDLASDPDELHNLWDGAQPPPGAAELLAAMLERTVALQDRAPLPTGRA